MTGADQRNENYRTTGSRPPDLGFRCCFRLVCAAMKDETLVRANLLSKRIKGLREMIVDYERPEIPNPWAVDGYYPVVEGMDDLRRRETAQALVLCEAALTKAMSEYEAL